MKFCCCANTSDIERLKFIKSLGCTCCEGNFTILERTDAKEIEEDAKKIKELDMPVVSYICLFPGHFRLLEGPSVYGEISDYLRNTLEKMKPLGGQYLVLGSSKARMIPEGMSWDEAKSRFVALLRDCIAPIAAEYGKTILIEELRVEETNFINNCREAMEIIRAVDHPNVKLLIDYYHAMLGGDTLEEIESYADYLGHVHIASPKRARDLPNEEDFEDCREFFSTLKRMGYEGAISLEGKPTDPFEVAVTKAMKVMTRAMQEA